MCRFIAPERLSPFYSNDKIPRKLKKKIKKRLGDIWNRLSNGQRRWLYLHYTNPGYRSFIISEICKN